MLVRNVVKGILDGGNRPWRKPENGKLAGAVGMRGGFGQVGEGQI